MAYVRTEAASQKLDVAPTRGPLSSPGDFWLVFVEIQSILVVFPQQRKLMGSSAQISSGAGRRRRFRKVPEGSGKFRKVMRKVPEGSGRFRCVLVQVLEASSGRFRKVLAAGGWRVLVQVPEAGSGEGSGSFRRVRAGSESRASSGRFRDGLVQVPEGSGKFRSVGLRWQVQRFWKEGSGTFRKVPESQGPGTGSGGFC